MTAKRVQRRPRHRWNPADRAAHLAAQRTSGLSVRRYSEAHGVPLSTLQLWRTQQKRQHAPSFAKVALIGAPATSPVAFTLRRRDGVIIEVTGLDQPGLISALRSILS